MKKTTNTIANLKPEAREKRRLKAKENYANNREQHKIKCRIAYYRHAYNADVVQSYVDRYGKTSECIQKLKQARKMHICEIPDI